jgi:hypothetical protein
MSLSSLVPKRGPSEYQSVVAELHATDPDRYPLCPRCGSLASPPDTGDLFPRWCSSCEATLLMRVVNLLITRYGCRGAKAKLAAIVRISARGAARTV